MDEIVDRACYIDNQYRSIHPFPDNLPGKLEPFLSRGTKNMDMVPVHYYPPKIESDSGSTTSTIGFHMAGFWVKCLNQRSLSRPECPENNDLVSFLFSHHDKI